MQSFSFLFVSKDFIVSFKKILKSQKIMYQPGRHVYLIVTHSSPLQEY